MKNSEFLLKEYSECFSQMKYYEQTQITALRFSIILTSAFFAVIPFLWDLSKNKSLPEDVNLILSFLCLFLFLATGLILASMVQKRIYFVFCTRQINAIRKFLIEKESPDFMESNKMYLTSGNIFKWMSFQSILFFSMILLSSSYFGGAIYFILIYWKYQENKIVISFSFLIISMLILVTIIHKYLTSKEMKNADKAVHKTN